MQKKNVTPYSLTLSQNEEGWKLVGPPHKVRYLSLLPPDGAAATDPDPATDEHTAITPLQAELSLTDLLRTIHTKLLASSAFRAWLALVSSLLPLSHAIGVRRFRPGLDYTLATGESETRLDVVLDLTPGVTEQDKGKQAEEDTWESGRWGGWQVSLLLSQVSDIDLTFYDQVLHGSTRR